ncbi:MAG: AzlC family ABC transporter permease [Spirochaetaceae bacterium]|jgi:4-azaleucine resistance transporter AzlC|nr:AzlC family ABC transporter permease [Spirochaetaceae bacterium]
MLNLRLFWGAFKYSLPVLLGYLATGAAFGLMMSEAGYTWSLALLMSVVMYTGAGQYIAVGLFASGAGLAESAIVQLVVNARHIAYGITMFKKFNVPGACKPYLIFALTDETFALLSALDGASGSPEAPEEKNRYGRDARERGIFMLYVSALNHLYWVFGTLIGAFAGAVLPFNFEGISFALTALFIVLMIEQIMRVKKILPFAIAALAAVLTVIFLPARVSLLSALAAALAAVQIFSPKSQVEKI